MPSLISRPAHACRGRSRAKLWSRFLSLIGKIRYSHTLRWADDWVLAAVAEMDQQVMDVHAFDTRRHVYASKNESTSNIASAVQYVTPLPAQFNVSSTSSSSSSLSNNVTDPSGIHALKFSSTRVCMAKRLDIGRYRQIWADPPPFCHCKNILLPPQFAGFLKIGFWGPTYKNHLEQNGFTTIFKM